MIVVIADDFTGAAELAGISLRYGQAVELFVGEVAYSNAEVVVISADSRSLSKEEALQRISAIVKQVLKMEPSLVYKKIDSVLRGYVADELKVQMQETGFNRAILLPANPSLGRTVVNGEYFVNEKRITETSFVDDPEFPVHSSFVKEILNDEVEVLRHTDKLPAWGIVVGEVSAVEDFDSWINKLDESWLLAGAGDFFSVLMEKKFQTQQQQEYKICLPHFYICGTAFEERKQFVKELALHHRYVVSLPEKVDEGWLDSVAAILRANNKLLLAIDVSNEPASVLRQKMAAVARTIIERNSIREIFVEGGSTAAAVLQELQINKLQPSNELSRGVVRMKAGELFITVKPGSYALPDEIKRLYKPD
ncbi:MAG: hypothetical protein IPH18_08460 [Chitinophagaceae bacterium]|nr:hypothetical protein [Chitinophagaceae bacterium]